MSVIGTPLLLGEEATGYQISRSVRLRSSASAYLNRTPASAGNRKTWTWSGWVKRGALGATSIIEKAGTTGANGWGSLVLLYFSSTDGLRVSSNNDLYLVTSQVFRDPSAWYHIVLLCDTTQATASNRLRLFVNGVEVTSFSTDGRSTYISQNSDSAFNNSVSHEIGRNGTDAGYLDGYLTEVNFIDGQALTPSSFGETDTITGVWKPKRYAGTYGTNGFYLNFSDNSAATAAAIGKDWSGNGNNWTPNNISVTAGVTYDSMLDVPIMYDDGGNGRGNYGTWNPLEGSYSTRTITNGNLNTSNGGNGSTYGNFGMSSGKWYCEVTLTAISGAAGATILGVLATTANKNSDNAQNFSPAVGYVSDGTKSIDTSSSSYGATYTTNDVIGIAVDIDGGSITFYKNGSSQGAISKTLAGQGSGFWIVYAVSASGSASNTWALNCGQRPFAYTPPTGFKALNTQNLPDSTIKNGGSYMAATLYTGNSATSTAGTTARTLTGTGFQPDLIWVKSRNNGGTWNNHSLTDSVRGANLSLSTNASDAQYNVTTDFSQGGVGAPSSDGFTIVSGTAGGTTNLNSSSGTYVAWQWKKSASAGFDIVTYTFGSTGISAINHGLGVAPKMILAKRRDTTEQWLVYHASGTTQSQYLGLNTTAAVASSANLWGSTAFSSTQFSFNATSGYQYVFYVFAEVAGFSKFGSYTGNGSTDGTFVYLGFRPRFLMAKRTDTAGYDWIMTDSSRSTYNVVDKRLFANATDAESSATTPYDFLSNGFKLRNTNTNENASGGTYIYMAFAENPFRNSLAR